MDQLYYDIRKELDANNNFEMTQYMTDHFPRRISGLGDDRRAAEWMVEKFRSYGLEAEVLEYVTYNSHPGASSVKVLSPETVILDSIEACHIASTAPEGLTLDLVYIGPGAYEDYQGIDVRGKCVVTEVSWAPGTPEKARIAAEMGATAILFANSAEDGTPDENLICRRAIKAVWGSPTLETFKMIPQIVGISISRKAGQYLKKLCEAGPVKVQVSAQAPRVWDTLAMPIAWLKGSEDPDHFVLAHGHLDAWEPGVTCNATGCSSMLELARVLAKHKGQLKRSILFACWNGHEIAESAGSTYYIDHNWEKLEKYCVGALFLDSTGMKGARDYAACSSLELKGFTEKTIKSAVGDEITVALNRKHGDQSFWGIGVSCIDGRVAQTPEYIERTHGAALGSWLHTHVDDMSKVDVKNLKKDLECALSILVGLANDALLPYDMTATLDDIIPKVAAILPLADASIDIESIYNSLNVLYGKVEKLNAAVAALQGCEISDQRVQYANRLQMKLARCLSNAFYTYTDRFEQDPYDYSKMLMPVPLLYTAVDLAKVERDSEEYFLMHTTVIRKRNRVAEAVNAAIEYCDLFMALIDSQQR